MSKIFENDLGVYISHAEYINNVYKSIKNDCYCLNPDLFKIFAKYKTGKMKSKRLKTININQRNEEQSEVELKFYKFIQNSPKPQSCNNLNDNNEAIQAADNMQKNLKNSILDLIGSNLGPAVVKEINESNYLFPENSIFFSKDVSDIYKHLGNRQFDFILLDPPWWNKYIRRKRKVSSDAYNMMYNNDFKNLPIDSLLSRDGLVAVWCTNSEQNYNALLNDIFPHWNVTFAAKWYWVKVTTKFEPVCDFSQPPGKQPYEKLIFARRKRTLPSPVDGKLLVSVPSAIHSHKPPLVEVLKDFLPDDAECLEIFARYLLPGWTSYGNEVLKLQHECLFS